MSNRWEFDVGTGRSAVPQRRRAGSPMRLLLLGDFSGRSSRGISDPAKLAERPLHRVDLDNVEHVLARVAPQLPLPADQGSPAAMLDFGSLDDFLPDRLYQRVAIFRRLRALRASLLDPASFERAAAELRAVRPAPAGAGAAPVAASANAESESGTLQRLLGSVPAAAPAPGPGTTGAVDALIHRAVAPHIVPSSSPQQSVYLAEIDALIGEQMRLLLHSPAFSALEMAWRSVQWLVSRIELNENLQLHLLDVTREELQADLLAAQGDLSRSGVARVLCKPDIGQSPHWSLFAGLYSVGPSADDLGLLAALGAVAVQAGGPVIAAAAPELFGCASVADLADPRQWQPLTDDVAQRWSRLRRSEVAPWIGLVAPRVLLRLPYGKATDPIEHFEFEEQPAESPMHETLLWGPGSLVVALLIGRAFTEGGWELADDPALELDDLPAYTFKRDGAAQLQPCGEAWLGERAALALLGHGVMPLLSDRQRAAVRLMRMQSVAEPPQPLAGPHPR